jgi:hypothetical protein
MRRNRVTAGVLAPAPGPNGGIMHRLARRTLVATVLVAAAAVPGWPQAAPDAPRIKLLDGGAAPRRSLRYTTTVGAQRSRSCR